MIFLRITDRLLNNSKIYLYGHARNKYRKWSGVSDRLREFAIYKASNLQGLRGYERKFEVNVNCMYSLCLGVLNHWGKKQENWRISRKEFWNQFFCKVFPLMKPRKVVHVVLLYIRSNKIISGFSSAPALLKSRRSNFFYLKTKK